MESNKLNDTELINQLKSASEGLLWLSESDYPFKTVYWENVDDLNAKLLELTDCTPKTTIEIRELDSFFKKATEEKDWYNSEEIAFGTNVCAPPFSFDEFCIADRESLLTDYPNGKELILRLTRVSIKVISEKRPNETRNCQNNNGIK